MSQVDIEEIRTRTRIEELIGEKYSLRKVSHTFKAQEHDSLVVFPDTQSYYWYSRDEGGDVIDLVGREILGYGTSWSNRNSQQFWEAVKVLAQRAGIRLETNEDFKKSPAYAERQLVQRLHEALLNTAPALAYATQNRAWQISSVKVAKLGYMPQDKKALLAELNLSDSWRSLIQKFPAGMLVYVHLENGRLAYLSGRSIEGKQHNNPPRDLAGERRLYFNHCYSPDAEQVVLVEGQADTVSFAEWGIPAIALAGLSANDDTQKRLLKHQRVFLALDNSPDAMAKARELAKLLSGSTCVAQFPEGIKDANEWLKQGGKAEDAQVMLNRAPHWLLLEAQYAHQMEGWARQDALKNLFPYISVLDEFSLLQFKEQMAKLGVKGRAFAELAKRAQKNQSKNGKNPQILSDGIPMLSPALGFNQGIALVTVSIVERTESQRLRHQPYLVTSDRKLHRLEDAQILTLNNKEIALRVIPEATEFLMRWRIGDIQRFLLGELVEPAEVFKSVHQTFTRFVDFKSNVESAILTLWTIGTYFYTMFPAYPYVALNGPKNSGKSTVLRVLQPLAFSMISTSDPTGVSMFRLINNNGCTVGIDEAERYHNPKDAGMQQIRQLLNSGYKQGMPAIRLIGKDMKLQAFDVYSPKILAAIAGLEDVLASRCIAIPMRRTDKKMPMLPPDYSGTEIRHQLYSLALSYHEHIRHNYYDRPEIHKLHNRSGELWQPLVALAAFFEEAGITGLLNAIGEAAVFDQQFSEGKSLSEREEALLQALEMLTRNTTDSYVWVKAAELRELVLKFLGLNAEQLRSVQWIGHLLKQLQLVNPSRRKHHAGGQLYAISRTEVLEMMRRYEVEKVEAQA
jgi:DNA primase